MEYNSECVCLKEEYETHMPWGWVNLWLIFMFGWTIPLKVFGDLKIKCWESEMYCSFISLNKMQCFYWRDGYQAVCFPGRAFGIASYPSLSALGPLKNQLWLTDRWKSLLVLTVLAHMVTDILSLCGYLLFIVLTFVFDWACFKLKSNLLPLL